MRAWHCGHDVRAGGNAHQQPFFPRQPPRHRERLFRFHRNFDVATERSSNPRNNGRVHVFQAFESVQRAVGLHGSQHHTRHLFTQPSSDADEGAAGAEAGDKVRHSPFRLPDDLGPRRVVVRPPVELVVVLVRVEVPAGSAA